jgi:hypothetical protein
LDSWIWYFSLLFNLCLSPLSVPSESIGNNS